MLSSNVILAGLIVTFRKSLKIPKGQSESVFRRRTDNTMILDVFNEKQTIY
jgi:hypothetical protein